jgi:N-acetylneuraminic acid mutarotase
MPKSANRWPDLLEAVTNNAVALLNFGDRDIAFSMLGLGSKKTYNDITNAAYILDSQDLAWQTLPALPGPGRIASTAQGVDGRVYLFGGYTVDARGNESSLPNLDIYDPGTGRWTRGADIPVAVDDSVSGVHLDRYIYLISGWSQTDSVAHVQVYDVTTDEWHAATPIKGKPVFGHAGAILGSEIIYCDGVLKSPSGVTPGFVASDECWRGEIDAGDFRVIHWSELPKHPGGARYRIAAGADPARGKIWFVGGTDNPYNYDGVGYNGKPSEPSATAFAWDAGTQKWEVLSMSAPASMDHRGLVIIADTLMTIGGMEPGQSVTTHVRTITIQ